MENDSGVRPQRGVLVSLVDLGQVAMSRSATISSACPEASVLNITSKVVARERRCGRPWPRPR